MEAAYEHTKGFLRDENIRSGQSITVFFPMPNERVGHAWKAVMDNTDPPPTLEGWCYRAVVSNTTFEAQTRTASMKFVVEFDGL